MGKNKSFIILPLFSFIVTFLCFILLGYIIELSTRINQQYLNPPHYYWYLELASFLILVTAIVGINTFTNALLVYMAYFKLCKKPISFAKALKQCWVQRAALLSWGIFYTCAGFILTLLERTGNFNRIIFTTANVSWHICAFLIMPFIVIEKLSPSLAFEKSRQYFSQSAILQVNILLLLSLYLLPVIILIHFTPYFVPQEIMNDIWFYGLFSGILIWLVWGNSFNAVLKAAFYLKLNGQKEFFFLKKDDVDKIIKD
ncbi:hypothetical protein [Legionella lansingensis]|nr:hypothetical protein [Legionella lansingensis]